MSIDTFDGRQDIDRSTVKKLRENKFKKKKESEMRI